MVVKSEDSSRSEVNPKSPVSKLAFRMFHKDEGTSLDSEVLDYHPFKLDLSLTEKCNLRCKHCSYALAGPVPTSDIKEEMLSSLSKYVFPHLRHIRLTGFNGEPLCSGMFDKCLNEIAQRGINLRITTNGTIMDKDRARRISEACDAIGISVEGVEASYEKVRGVKWAKVVHNIELLRNARESTGSSMKIILNVTVLRECLEDYPLLFKLQNAGVDAIRLRHFYPMSIAQVSQSLLYNMEQANVFFDHMRRLSDESGIELDLPNSFGNCNIGEMSKNMDGDGPERLNCHIPWEGLALDPTGVVRACCAGPRMGLYQPKDKDFMGVWNNLLYRKLRRTINGIAAPQPCRNCPVFCMSQASLVYPLRFAGPGLSASLGGELLLRCKSLARMCKRCLSAKG